ncbi:MAG: hypothetical protein ACYDBQ_05325 [Thermoplasmatota archaeon]
MAVAPWAVLLLEAATAGCGAWGVVRVERLRALADDRRLTRLAWFFGLLSASFLVQLVGTALVVGAHGRPTRFGGVAVLQHGLLIAALVVAVVAYTPPWKGAAPVVTLFGPAGVLVFAEVALALYLAALAFVNQRRRRNLGSMKVAAGFLLLALGHLGFLAADLIQLRAARPLWAEALAFAGVLLLATSVPRRRAAL